MQRNITNHSEIDVFLITLAKDRTELVQRYIQQNIKNYIYKNAKVKQDWLFYVKSPQTDIEDKIKKAGGPFHKVVLDDKLYSQMVKACDYIGRPDGDVSEKVFRISVDDAIEKHEDIVSKGEFESVKTDDKKIKYQFKNGHKLVYLSDPKDRADEGRRMKHCLTEENYKSSDVFSFRDAEDKSLLTVELKGQSIYQIVGPGNSVIDKKYYPYMKKMIKANNWQVEKFVSTGGNVFSSMIGPAMCTFLVFQWKHVLAWLQLGSAGQLGGLLQNPAFSGAIDLSFLIFAGYQWFTYFANFNPGGQTQANNLLDHTVMDEVQAAPEEDI